jgi:hypothetical protein
MSVDAERERERFEAHVRSIGWRVSFRNGDGYFASWLNEQFIGWLAAKRDTESQDGQKGEG